MNCFFILLLYFFVRVRCDTVFQISKDKKQRYEGETTNILASVRQYPSMLHKCTGTFIAPDALLTTAKCLYCEDCELFVHALSSQLTDENQKSKGAIYRIKKTVIHPDYERAPLKNDVGLIQLVEKAANVVVFRLQTNVPDSSLIVDTYRWQFKTNYRDYFLEKVTEQTISNAACSSFFNQYIDYKHICTHRNQSVFLGSFDQGVPLVVNTTGAGTIVGIYGAEGKFRSSTVEIYYTVFPFAAWVHKILACNFNCTSSTTDETASTTIPTFAPTDITPSPFTLIPLNDNNTFPPGPMVYGPNELDEAQESKLEEKAPNAATGDDNSQKSGKPLMWSADFPFSEQKQAPFKPKVPPGKRFT